MNLVNSPWVPWRFRHLGGIINTVFLVGPRRERLRREVGEINATRPNDITFILPLRNRFDYRLVNTLGSIRRQDYPESLIRILLVDYDSDPEVSRQLSALCEEFRTDYLHVAERPEWNKSHCLNIGIRQVETKWLLTSDTDIIFESNYTAEAVETLLREPLSVVYSRCMDLPDAFEPALQRLAELREPPDLSAFTSAASPRSFGDANPGISCSYTHFYHQIRGYDEFYRVWGAEDNDLARRMEYLGLCTVSLAERTVYFHQWHAKFEGVRDADPQAAAQRNTNYFENNHSIVRNDEGWGDPGR